MSKGWIGVDLDGTLAEYHGWPEDGSIGPPIPFMLQRVKKWLAEGKQVKIMTARVSPNSRGHREVLHQRSLIANWCIRNVGLELDVTCEKDYGMVELWDDRAVRVERNTGRMLSK